MEASIKLAKAMKYLSPSDNAAKFYVDGDKLIFKGDLSWFIISDFFENNEIKMIIKLPDLNSLMSLKGTPRITVHTSGEIIATNGKQTVRVRYTPVDSVPVFEHPDDESYFPIVKTIKYGKSIYGNSSSTCSLTAVNKNDSGYFIMADSKRICYIKGEQVPEMDVTSLQPVMSTLAKDDVKIFKTTDQLHILCTKDCNIRAAVKVHRPVMHKGAEITVQEVQDSQIGEGTKDVVIRIKPNELLDIQSTLTTMNFLGMIYYEVEAKPGQQDLPGNNSINDAILKVSFTDAARKSFNADLPCKTNIKGKFKFTCHQFDTSLINFVIADSKPNDVMMKIAIDLTRASSANRKGKLMVISLESQTDGTIIQAIQAAHISAMAEER